LRQVPTQVIGEGSVPGGHDDAEPPQHEQRKPSTAQ
jgi:hypothetical protein